MLTFSEIPDEKTGNDLSYLKSSNSNFNNDDDGYDDTIARHKLS